MKKISNFVSVVVCSTISSDEDSTPQHEIRASSRMLISSYQEPLKRDVFRSLKWQCRPLVDGAFLGLVLRFLLSLLDKQDRFDVDDGIHAFE
jgi:hypothetical protein